MPAQVFTVPPSPWRRSFLVARDALSRDDRETAREILERLARERPDDLEVRLYAAWVRAKLATPTPQALDALEALALRVLDQCQALAVPLCVLGDAALRRADLHAARHLYRRALEADPTLLDARRGSKLVDDRLRRRSLSAAHRVTDWMAAHLGSRLYFAAFLGVFALLCLARLVL